MRTLIAVLVAILASQPSDRLAAQRLSPRDSALHALNRLAYGPRPGDVDRVAAMGTLKWIDQQLDPGRLDDRVLAERERAFSLLGLSREDLARTYLDAQRARRERQRNTGADSTMRQGADAADQTPEALRARRLAGQLQELAVVRAAMSERQLAEVMVDFWTNHFNVFFGKGADRFLLPDYIEHVIRPHALGKFEDLLVATAQSPAMMFYLDNWQSVAPGSRPPQFARAAARRPEIAARMPQGINENYARELMELHTLGVDGGYTQADVIAVARILTGWSIARPQQGGGFEYHDWAHDGGMKVVLGDTFPAGHGQDEGMRLLHLLAREHATMHHVSHQLCARFVADDPPDGCVDDAVAAWQRGDGDIREVLRAIFHGPDFWAPQNVANKVKTPLEFVVSAVRAMGADPDTTPRLAQVVARLGEPLYQHVAPDGYPERQDDWVNSGALLARMNASVGLAAGRLPGVLVALDTLIPASGDAAALLDAIDRRLLGGAMSDHTRTVITQQLADVADPVARRSLAIGLALGGPEFQRQ
ncbi:MAG TPA: DUF1800 domain-containing protein [Gemmatimonadales bacterium]|nr:DUF1800 domain-containing protein [Gemmatimonadales bacterium]